MIIIDKSDCQSNRPEFSLLEKLGMCMKASNSAANGKFCCLAIFSGIIIRKWGIHYFRVFCLSELCESWAADTYRRQGGPNIWKIALLLKKTFVNPLGALIRRKSLCIRCKFVGFRKKIIYFHSVLSQPREISYHRNIIASHHWCLGGDSGRNEHKKLLWLFDNLKQQSSMRDISNPDSPIFRSF